MSIESRIKKIEDAVVVTTKPKTLTEMLQAFIAGEYGNIADLLRLILAGVHIDPVKSGYPEELVKYLQELHAK